MDFSSFKNVALVEANDNHLTVGMSFVLLSDFL